MYVEIETVGEEVGKDEVFGTVEAVKTVSDLFMPVSGVVKEKNDAIDGNPEVVNKDPYGEGWLIKVEIKDASELNGLMDATTYRAHIGQ